MPGLPDPRLAQRDAQAAKARMLGSVDRVKARLLPAVLKRDAVDALRDRADQIGEKLSGAAARRPALATAVTAATAFILLYRPIRGIVRLFLKEK